MSNPPTLTRIRNNQVYNSDIDAQTKLKPLSIVGGLWHDPLIYTGSLTVGNLTVNGNTTSLDTISIVAADPVIVLNRNFSGSSTYDVGFILGRGNQTNTALVWDETNKEFSFFYTSATTTNSYYGSVPNTGYANLHAYGALLNNATITTANITNDIVANTQILGGTIDNVQIGNTTPNSGVFTSVTTSNDGQVIGWLTGAIGANIPNTGAFTDITVSRTSQLWTVSASTVSAPQIGNSGTLLTGTLTTPYQPNVSYVGILDNLTVAGNTILDSDLSVAGNINAIYIGNSNTQYTGTIITNAQPFITSVGKLISLDVIGGVNANAFTATYDGQFTGWLTGAIGANVPNTGVFTEVRTTNSGQVIGYITGAIGANVANTGVFTTLTADVINAYGNGISNGIINGTEIRANAEVAGVSLNGFVFNSGSYDTGLIQKQGQTGNLSLFAGNIEGVRLTNNILQVFNTANIANTLSVTGNISSDSNIVTMTGNVVANNYYYSNGIPLVDTLYTNSNVQAYLPVNTVEIRAPYFYANNSGQFIGYVTGAIGANTANSGVFTNVIINDTTDSYNSTSGALQVNGGISTGANLYVYGDVTIRSNLYVQGNTTTLGSIDLTISDSVINLHTYANLEPLTINDLKDIGFKLHYFDTELAGGDNLAFLGRANDTGYLEWYTSGTENSSNVFVDGYYGTIKTGELLLANGNASTNSTTGTLRVIGGAGITGNVFAGAIQNTPIGNGQASTGEFTTLIANNMSYFNDNLNVSGSIIPTSDNNYDIGNLTSKFRNLFINTFVLGNIKLTDEDRILTIRNIEGNLSEIHGSAINNTVIGNNGPTEGTFSNLTSTISMYGNLFGTLNGNIGYITPNAAAFTTVWANGQVAITNSTVSTSTTTGALTVSGGVGIVDNINVGNTAYIGANVYANNFIATNSGQFIGYVTGAIGSNVANTGAFTTLSTTSDAIFNGNIYANSCEISTSTSTGAIVVNGLGGVGIGGAINIGGGVNLQGNGYITTTETTATVFNTVASKVDAFSSAIAINMGAVTGTFTISNPYLTGTQTTQYLFNNVATTINFAGNATAVNVGAVTGNTTINNGLFVANITDATSSTYAGAIIAGGLAVAKNVNVGGNLIGTVGTFTGNITADWLIANTAVYSPLANIGNISITGNTITSWNTVNAVNITTPSNNGNIVINSNKLDGNLIVHGNGVSGYNNVLVVNGKTGQVGIRQNPASMADGASFQINTTDSMIIPVGQTADRPTPDKVKVGMFRYNSSINYTEYWDGDKWNTNAAQFTVIVSDSFTGNGTQVDFTLTDAATTASVIVSINGIVQIPSTAYTVLNKLLTFTEAPLATDIIDVRILTTSMTIDNIGDGATQLLLSNTEPSFTTLVQGYPRIIANTSTYFNGGISTFPANISLSQFSTITVDNFPKATFRSAKYIISTSDIDNNIYEVDEVLVVHNGIWANAQTTSTLVTMGASSFVTCSATVSGSQVLLRVNSSALNSVCNVQQIYVPV